MRLIRFLALGLAGLLGLSLAGGAAVTQLEEHDPFCASCHRAPEVVYLERSVSAAAALVASSAPDVAGVEDLASYHYSQESEFRCIDCHRGDDSLPQRLRVLALAARDTVTFLVGEPDNAIEKAKTAAHGATSEVWLGSAQYNHTPDILNAGCRKCHQETLTLVGFENHFHNKLPASLLALAQTGQLTYPPDWTPPADGGELLHPVETVISCLDCHQAHVASFGAHFFLDINNVVFPACVQCHLEAGHGPLDLQR